MVRVIHVDGVQGSGKTWLCNQIKKHVHCVDTDDLWYAALADVQKRKLPVNREHMDPVIARLRSQHEADAARQGKVVVYAGMTVSIETPEKYFVALHTADRNRIYRRLLKRELMKLHRHHKDLLAVLNNDAQSAHNIESALVNTAHLSLRFPVSFEEFENDYQQRVDVAIANGAILRTQTQLVTLFTQLNG